LFDVSQALEYLKDGALMIQIWGKQKLQKTKKTINTKTAMLKESLSRGQLHAQSNEKVMITIFCIHETSSYKHLIW